MLGYAIIKQVLNQQCTQYLIHKNMCNSMHLKAIEPLTKISFFSLFCSQIGGRTIPDPFERRRGTQKNEMDAKLNPSWSIHAEKYKIATIPALHHSTCTTKEYFNNNNNKTQHSSVNLYHILLYSVHYTTVLLHTLHSG